MQTSVKDYIRLKIIFHESCIILLLCLLLTHAFLGAQLNLSKEQVFSDATPGGTMCHVSHDHPTLTCMGKWFINHNYSYLNFAGTTSFLSFPLVVHLIYFFMILSYLFPLVVSQRLALCIFMVAAISTLY